MIPNVDTIEARLHKLEAELRSLRRTLAGDGTAVNLGVIGVLEEHTKIQAAHERRIGNVEKTIQRVKWTVVGYAAGGAMVGGGLVAAVAKVLSGGSL